MAFCIECGNSLPDAAKFCPQCGTKVATAPEAAPAPDAAPPPAEAALPLPPELREKFDAVRSELQGERREVVVLFADLKGYTSMSEKLDAEEVTFLMNRLLRELAGAVYEYEGYVDKFIGDAVMALFGAPLAHEDDPERGVLAGLRMLEVVAQHNARTEFDLALRVGINLGEVIAAHLGSEMSLQYTVIGDTVNVASRLEGAAEPNTVLVSEAVWNRVRRRFEGVELPPMTLKGKAEPIRGWRVEGLSAKRRRRAQSPFVGRETELEHLASAFKRAAAGSMSATVLEAEAGVGKTRLVREALARAPEGTRVAEVLFTPIRLPGQRPPAAEIFAQLADDEAAAIEMLGAEASKHEQGLAGLAREADPEAAPAAAEGIDPAAARQNRWLAAVALLRAAAQQGPLALVLEDLNWADEAGREFLAFLLARVEDAPLVAYLTARRTDLDFLPETVERIVLGPLDAKSAESLLGTLLDEMPPEERRELIRRSAGNPLFLEELARALAEAGGAGRAVPSMLQGLMMSRIDRLESPLQHLLQMGAVLGLRFPLPLLSRMFRIEAQTVRFEDALADLEERGFLEVQGEEGRFLSALMQEVAYGGLLVRVRRVLHESAARLGEERYADRREAEAAFFAHHYWYADLPGEAAPHLWIAGRTAAAMWDLPAAEQFLRRAAEALEKGDRALDTEEAARFEETLGNVLLHRGAMEEAVDWFQKLEQRGRSAERLEWQARGVEYQGRIAWYRGRLDEAQKLFEQGLEVVPPEAREVTADLNNDLGIVFFYRHDFDAAFAYHSRALELRLDLDDRLGIAKSCSNIGNILLHLKRDYQGAEENYGKALEVATEIGDRHMQYSALNNLGLLAMTRGLWEEAMETLDRAMAILAEIGWSYARFVTLQNRAWCEIEMGRLGDALRHLEVCRTKGEDVLEPLNRLATRAYLFDTWLHVGARDRAREILDEQRRMVDELELKEEEEEVRLREARWLAENGRWEEAAEAFERTEEEAVRQGELEVELIARAHRVRARARAGLPEIDACDPQRAGGNAPLAILVRYLLADGAATRAPSLDADAELADVADRAAEYLMKPLEMAAAARLGAVREELGDIEGARTAYERAVAAADELAASLPDEHRQTFESRPDIADLRRRLAPA